MFYRNKKEEKNISKDKSLEEYIYRLEQEKIHLESEIKTLTRQVKRIKINYIEPLRNILGIINENYDTEQKISYINTQINHFMSINELELYIPKIGEPHDKSTMIVEETIATSKSEDNDKIECILAVGIKSKENILVPAKVRIFKGE